MEFSYFSIFGYIGIFVVVYKLYDITARVFHICRVYLFPTYPNFLKYGGWAVVTGSTNGIGKSIAFQLASKGQNVILIARNLDKLQNVAHEIENQFKVQVKYLKIDFSEDEFIYEKIEKFLDDVDIGVLVNNVGVNTAPLPFLEATKSPDIIENLVKVNMVSVYKMHQIVLPGMLRRHRGLIMNISSASAVKPLYAAYGATKAFVDYFSQALSHEYAGSGVTIQSCLPAFVQTNLTKDYKIDSMFFRTSDSYVQALLGTVEKESKTFGCWQHSFQMWILLKLPNKLFYKIMLDGVKDLYLKSTEKKSD